jgi:hypothetical protein
MTGSAAGEAAAAIMSDLDTVRALTRGQLEEMLDYLRGWNPEGFAYALAQVTRRPVLPPHAHGPNHIDNAGHATAACFPACAPGTCYSCGATVDAAGVVHEAVTA